MRRITKNSYMRLIYGIALDFLVRVVKVTTRDQMDHKVLLLDIRQLQSPKYITLSCNIGITG